MKKSNILIIEDDQVACKTLEDFLKLRGFTTCVAVTGTEGLAKLREHHIDIVLVDLDLPDIPGEEIVRIVKSEYPFTESIVLTGNSSLDTAVKCMKGGSYDYILKPLDCRKLISRINDAMASIDRCGRFN